MTQRRVRRASGWLRAELQRPPPPPVESAPQSAASSHGDRARSEYESGQAALAMGRLAVAYNYFVVARGFAAGDDLLIADIMTAQGRVRLAQENFGAAAAAFREALAHNPAHVEARVGLAELALATHRPAGAIELLHEALPLVPDAARRAELHLALATTHRRQGRSLLARPHLKAAARLGVNPLAVVWCFLWTLEAWQWLLAVGLALAVGVSLGMNAADPIRAVATALLTVAVLLALLVVWTWQRTRL